jgi:broad specificity phosphatase PhoE
MTRLWWVRHGPTHAKEMIGWTDRPADLSDHAALDRLRAHLPATAPIVSSDLIRAVATAETLGRGRCLPPRAALREIHFGAWEGLRFAEAEARDAALIRMFWEEPGAVSAPGGESWGGLQARVKGSVQSLLADHAGDLIVVAHFGVILTQVEHALGIPTTQAFAQKIEPLSVTCIEHAGDGARLLSVNHIP